MILSRCKNVFFINLLMPIGMFLGQSVGKARIGEKENSVGGK